MPSEPTTQAGMRVIDAARERHHDCTPDDCKHEERRVGGGAAMLCDASLFRDALDKWKAELLELVLVRERQRDTARALADELAAALRAADHCHPAESRCRECGRWNTENCEPDPKGVIAAALAKWEASK